MGDLPVEAIRASLRGQRTLQIFDSVKEAGHEGVSISELIEKVYGQYKPADPYNTIKVTMIRVKERLQQYGWTIESGSSSTSASERVYRLKRS
jgi:hypothetical protein